MHSNVQTVFGFQICAFCYGYAVQSELLHGASPPLYPQPFGCKICSGWMILATLCQNKSSLSVANASILMTEPHKPHVGLSSCRRLHWTQISHLVLSTSVHTIQISRRRKCLNSCWSVFSVTLAPLWCFPLLHCLFCAGCSEASSECAHIFHSLCESSAGIYTF